MTWYDCIKQQWEWGCYQNRSQLDIYVNVGWITADQADEIAGVTKQQTASMTENTSTSTTPTPANVG